MLDLRHFIRVYDQTLDAALCRRIIDEFEANPQGHQERSRVLEASPNQVTGRWIEMEAMGLAAADSIQAALIERAKDYAGRYARDTGHSLFPFRLESFRIKRYDPTASGMFPPHVDVSSTASMHRMLAVLWYLNDVEQGGDTWFGKIDVKVPPRQGRLLMFPPTFMYPHAGMPPKGRAKYIIGTYLSYASPHPAGANPTEAA